MNSSVLIANSYFLSLDPKQFRQMQPYPPLAALYAASVLRNAGFSVTFADTVFAKGPNDIYPHIHAHAGNIFFICDDGFNYLTKMCLVNMRAACFAMIAEAKRNGCTVVVSSSDASDHKDDYLSAGADFLILGEVEETAKQLMHHIASGNASAPEHIHGLAYMKAGTIYLTSPREVMHDLDAIPFPAWDMVDMERYKNAWVQHHGYFSINMSTTRGCPFKCNWCAKPIYGNRYNARSVENVVDEIALLQKEYGITHIWFCDDIFGLKPGWIKKFHTEIRSRGIQIRYKIQARVDLLLEEEGGEKFSGNIRALAGSGCDEVWVGAESGAQSILDAMDKGTQVHQIFSAVRNMQKEGIKPCLFLQFGYPGETITEIRKTISMLTELVPYDIGISVSYPLPGTVFYARVKDQLREKQNWDDSDDLAMMYRGTYSPAFYRALHRYVHKRFRVAQGFRALGKTITFRKPGERASYRIFGLLYFIPASAWYGIRMRLHMINGLV